MKWSACDAGGSHGNFPATGASAGWLRAEPGLKALGPVSGQEGWKARLEAA